MNKQNPKRGEEFENLKEKAKSVGTDLSWVTGVCNSISDGKQ
jgi:hypothetical protein